jgi:hypothetical protein
VAALVTNPLNGQGQRVSRAGAGPYGRRFVVGAEKEAHLACCVAIHLGSE